MVVSYHRPTKAIVHLDAIIENVNNQVQALGADQTLFAVVKADGYGHGAVQTALAAKEGGATGFCVATIDEGLELRKAGLTDPILILGVISVDDLPLVSEYQLAITVATMEWLEEAGRFLQAILLPRPIAVHLKVDTGMGRIGFRDIESVKAAIKLLEAETSFDWDGIFTHYATADEVEDGYWKQQQQAFHAYLAALPNKPRYVHDSNSATAFWHERALGNLVRYGVGLYGLNPSGGVLAEPFELKPALELVSELIQVKHLPKGSGIGYGETYVTKNEEWIGTVPIGYADGWQRKMQGFSVLVEGEYCEIVGRVCMDQMMIRLPREYSVGTKVTLIGQNQAHEITMQEVADYLDTIHYEVACLISERVPREYQR